VLNADVFYAIFLFNTKRDRDAIEVENLIEFDVQEEAPDDEPSAEAEIKDNEIEENLTPVEIIRNDREKDLAPAEAVADVDSSHSPQISKRLQKIYARAAKSLKNLSISTGNLDKEVIKTYKDIEVTAHKDALPEIHRFKSKIKGLLSCLANGERRGKIEPIQVNAGNKQLYSLRISDGDRLIIEILSGNLIGGVEKVYILAAEGHYNSSLKGRAVRDPATGIQIPDWNE
jgi:hypothetical protein